MDASSAARREQRILGISIAVILTAGLLGVVFGLLSGSLSIVFDGFFSLVDASMTGLAILVSRLIARPLSSRFQFGFWHLEPVVLAINGSLLMLVSLYALINAVGTIFAGGRAIEFGWAMLYAAALTVIGFAMALWTKRANREVGSEFVALDSKGWLMSSSVSCALLVSFAAAYLMTGTDLEPYVVYADPAILAVLCLVLLPVPARTVASAIREFLMMAPSDLDHSVRAAASAAVSRYGFSEARTYVAKFGRGRTIEVHFVVPAGYRIETIDWTDRIRQEISDAVGFEGPDRWLIVTFTADPKWAC
ncbi:cation transporter [Fulvimarina endophytica]|uniref:Cation transporter n=1 Tax=Fulvimarina endophytica TaxID=2293836 RepID=A0A371X8N4_9HYPH|nr:cation transporter [Fulvimarina endophytica]RFC65424.1 cation transporter [Fulvimarina endophytica]